MGAQAEGPNETRGELPSEPGRALPDQAEDLARRELPSVERLLGLSDGVVAIAITLIVFQLHVPKIAHVDSPSELAHALGQLGGELSAYIVAFFVIAEFWLAHHRVFRLVRGHDEGLAWVNFVFLFTITAMPFTSNLIGAYQDNPVAVDIFAVNLMLASLSTQAVVVYGRRRGLLVPGVAHLQTANGTKRAVMVGLVSVASVTLAWYSTSAAKYVWLALIVMPWVTGWTSGPSRRRLRARTPPGSAESVTPS